MPSDEQEADPVLEEQLDRVLLTLERGGEYGLLSSGETARWLACVYNRDADRFFPAHIAHSGHSVTGQLVSEDVLRQLLSRHGEVDWSATPPKQVRLRWAFMQQKLLTQQQDSQNHE